MSRLENSGDNKNNQYYEKNFNELQIWNFFMLQIQ